MTRAVIIAYLRQHILGTIVSAVLAGGGAMWLFTSAIEQNRIDRFEDSMLSEYREVAGVKRQLYVSIERFTFAVAKGDQPDPSLISEMSKDLVDLHQRVEIFALGLEGSDRDKIVAVQLALTEMKKEIQKVRSKNDLQYLAGRLAQFEQAYKEVEPIVERKIGKPIEVLSG